MEYSGEMKNKDYAKFLGGANNYYMGDKQMMNNM